MSAFNLVARYLTSDVLPVPGSPCKPTVSLCGKPSLSYSAAESLNLITLSTRGQIYSLLRARDFSVTGMKTSFASAYQLPCCQRWIRRFSDITLIDSLISSKNTLNHLVFLPNVVREIK